MNLVVTRNHDTDLRFLHLIKAQLSSLRIGLSYPEVPDNPVSPVGKEEEGNRLYRMQEGIGKIMQNQPSPAFFRKTLIENLYKLPCAAGK